MQTFGDAIALRGAGPSAWVGHVDASWVQGKGVVGGLVAALLLRGIEQSLPSGLAVARITTAFCAALAPGPVRVEVRVVREGRNVAVLDARLFGRIEGAERVVATAMATACRKREHPLVLTPSRSGLPDVDGVSDGPEEHYLPVFAQHFSFRQSVGPRPFSGEGPGLVGGWCRLDEDAPIDAACLVALLDAWPPAAVGLCPRWCPVASLEMSVALETDAPIAARTWLYYEARCERVAEGLADERSSLHLPDGTRIATAQQLIVLLPPPVEQT